MREELLELYRRWIEHHRYVSFTNGSQITADTATAISLSDLEKKMIPLNHFLLWLETLFLIISKTILSSLTEMELLRREKRQREKEKRRERSQGRLTRVLKQVEKGILAGSETIAVSVDLKADRKARNAELRQRAIELRQLEKEKVKQTERGKVTFQNEEIDLYDSSIYPSPVSSAALPLSPLCSSSTAITGLATTVNPMRQQRDTRRQSLSLGKYGPLPQQVNQHTGAAKYVSWG
jgi:hypothetical protein